jgi:hypothetical protein
MFVKRRPPDPVGGRPNFTPALFAGSHTLSLAASAVATAKLVESFGQRLPLPQSPCDALWYVGWAFVAMSFVDFIPPLRREWDRCLARTGRPLLWVAGTAAVFGSLAGASITGIRFLANPGPALALCLLVSIAGALAGAGWVFVCGSRARPPDPDYDDRNGA